MRLLFLLLFTSLICARASDMSRLDQTDTMCPRARIFLKTEIVSCL